MEEIITNLFNKIEKNQEHTDLMINKLLSKIEKNHNELTTTVTGIKTVLDIYIPKIEKQENKINDQNEKMRKELNGLDKKIERKGYFNYFFSFIGGIVGGIFKDRFK